MLFHFIETSNLRGLIRIVELEKNTCCCCVFLAHNARNRSRLTTGVSICRSAADGRT